MKNFKTHIILVALLSIFSFGCNDVLDVKLDDEIRSSDAITDNLSLNSAIIGLYDIMQSSTYYGGEFVVAQALTGGIADATGFRERFAQLDNSIVPSSNEYIESNWVDVYALVNSSNLILEKINELNLDNPDAEGAAYFFRALGLFDALRQFGEFTDSNSAYGIPVYTNYVNSNTALIISRSSVSESFLQIINDLKQAIDLLSYDSNKFTVSKGTAEALLARVYLYQGDFTNAELMASNVIDNSDYALNSRYNDIYDIEGSDEAIFELQFLGTDGNGLTNLLSTSPPEVSADYYNFYEAMYDDDDPRGYRYYDTGRVVYVDKYGTSDSDLEGNSIVIKLSEMYLIRAEAKARLTPADLSSAISDLNTIRTRSLPSQGYTASDIPNYEAFISALINERARELAFEGHRWFDIVRLGKAESILGIEAYRTVYPIPQREIKLSKGVIVQNPGY